MGLLIGCESEPKLCDEIECGPGICVAGICDCPEGFSGSNCEIEDCFGTDCINGDCDPVTETCNCDPYYYGESCDIFWENGELVNGNCNCLTGYEGKACETESRCKLIGWWGCEEWTSASQIGGTPIPMSTLGSIKFEEGFKTSEVELFPTESSNGLLLLNSNTKIIGQVTENSINFELQNLTNQRTVYGSASLGNVQYLRIQLYLFNPETSLTEVAKGTYILARSLKE